VISSKKHLELEADFYGAHLPDVEKCSQLFLLSSNYPDQELLTMALDHPNPKMVDAHSSYFPQNLFGLQGRTALVTGGGTGIGLMITRGFAAAGAKVYITGRRLDVLEKSASEWNQLAKGGQIIP
jgi:hypothetical protein